jgi:hypothetical protein
MTEIPGFPHRKRPNRPQKDGFLKKSRKNAGLSTKTGLNVDGRQNFPGSSTKAALYVDGKEKSPVIHYESGLFFSLLVPGAGLYKWLFITMVFYWKR